MVDLHILIRPFTIFGSLFKPLELLYYVMNPARVALNCNDTRLRIFFALLWKAEATFLVNFLVWRSKSSCNHVSNLNYIDARVVAAKAERGKVGES